MKKVILITSVFVLLMSLSACKSKEEKMLDAGLENMEKIIEMQEKMLSGEITAEEADEFMEENAAEQKEIMQMEVKEMPKWVKDMGLDEPKGMTLNTDLSEATTEKEHGFNSVQLVFEGDYETAMQEAKRIANAANIPVGAEFKMAQESMEMMKNMGGITEEMLAEMDAEMMGIMYTTFSLMGDPADMQDQYQTVIQV